MSATHSVAFQLLMPMFRAAGPSPELNCRPDSSISNSTRASHRGAPLTRASVGYCGLFDNCWRSGSGDDSDPRNASERAWGRFISLGRGAQTSKRMSAPPAVISHMMLMLSSSYDCGEELTPEISPRREATATMLHCGLRPCLWVRRIGLLLWGTP